MTFTDAELDTLTAMLLQTDPSRIGYSGPRKYNRDGTAAAAAITYLRSRDAIGAVVMRERAASEVDYLSQVFGRNQDGDFYMGEEATLAAGSAFHEAEGFIRALPLPTTAEVLAHALGLPEIKAMVEAAVLIEHSVLGETGFASAVRGDSGFSYPWPSLDVAEEKLRTALAALEAAK